MTLETESLRRELKAEIGGLRDMIVDALKRIDVHNGILTDHSRELNRLAKQVDAPVASALEALVAELRAENEKLRRELNCAVSENQAFNLKAAGEINEARRQRDAAVDRHKRDSALMETEIRRLSSEVAMLAHVASTQDASPLLKRAMEAEQQTAEAIAKWLDADADCAQTLRAKLAADVRNGKWKP